MLRNRYYKVDIRKARSVYAVHAIFTKDTSLSSVKHPNEKKKKKRKKSLISLPRYTFILQLSHSILHGLSRSYKLQVFPSSPQPLLSYYFLHSTTLALVPNIHHFVKLGKALSIISFIYKP